MTKNKEIIIVPEGYDLEDLISLDDSVMCGEQPRFIDDVEVKYG